MKNTNFIFLCKFLLIILFVSKEFYAVSQNTWNGSTTSTITNGRIGVGTSTPTGLIEINRAVPPGVALNPELLINRSVSFGVIVGGTTAYSNYFEIKKNDLSFFGTPIISNILTIDGQGHMGLGIVNNLAESKLEIRNQNEYNLKSVIIGTKGQPTLPTGSGPIIFQPGNDEEREIFFANNLAKNPYTPLYVSSGPGSVAPNFTVYPRYNPIVVDGDQGLFWSDGKDIVASSTTTGTNQGDATLITPAQKRNTQSGFVIAPYNNTNMGIRITKEGNVGIGTPMTNNPLNYKLGVNGLIMCKEIVVDINDAVWPDYVFNKNYNLMSIDSLSSYINTNKHLPLIPSAAEMNCNGEYKVGEMQVSLLSKIEELTLYIIELNKKNALLEEKVNQLLIEKK